MPGFPLDQELLGCTIMVLLCCASVILMRYLDQFWLTVLCAWIGVTLVTFITLMPITLFFQQIVFEYIEFRLLGRDSTSEDTASRLIAWGFHVAIAFVIGSIITVDHVIPWPDSELTLFSSAIGSIPLFFTILFASLFLVGTIAEMFFGQKTK